MPRVYMKREIESVIEAVHQKCVNALACISSGELAVQESVRAHLDPIDVNRVGVEAYQAGGILLAEAAIMIASLFGEVTRDAVETAINSDVSATTDGLGFPRIAAIGAPREFDLFQVDVDNVSGTDRGVIYAMSAAESGAAPDPFTQLSVGGKVLIEKINADRGAGSVINGKKLQGIIVEVQAVDVSGGFTRLKFVNTFTFYEAGSETATTTTAATHGNKGATLVLREIETP